VVLWCNWYYEILIKSPPPMVSRNAAAEVCISDAENLCPSATVVHVHNGALAEECHQHCLLADASLLAIAELFVWECVVEHSWPSHHWGCIVTMILYGTQVHLLIYYLTLMAQSLALVVWPWLHLWVTGTMLMSSVMSHDILMFSVSHSVTVNICDMQKC